MAAGRFQNFKNSHAMGKSRQWLLNLLCFYAWFKQQMQTYQSSNLWEYPQDPQTAGSPNFIYNA